MPALLLAAVFALATSPALPASPDDRAYVGVVRYVLDVNDTSSVVYTVEGEVRLSYVETVEGVEHYAPTRVAVTWSVTGVDDAGCTLSGHRVVEGTAAATYPNELGSMDVDPGDGYYMGIASIPFGALFDAVTYTCGPATFTQHGTDYGAFMTGLQEGLFDHDPKGNVLRDSIVVEGQHGSVATYTWDLRRATFGAELIIEPDAYDTWLPLAGADEAAEGNTMAVAARVRAGGEPVEAVRFRFELVGTSREPGIAMNYPRPTFARTTPDFRLTAVTGETARDAEEGQWIEAGRATDAVVEVTSFDYGGWTTLRVTATLPDGTELVGRLATAPDQDVLPIPKRSATSLVAEAWRAAIGAGADAVDDDATPVGDGHAGDGLTVYQEYRGVVENGRHVRTDPRRKDLFVLNTIGGGVLEGILLFQAVSELHVHHAFTLWEFDPSRVINTNRAAGPHAVDQHGLWLRRLNPVFGEAVGGPGTPKAVVHIDLGDLGFSASTTADPAQRRAKLAHVAHELLHGVNVHHHGDQDEGIVRWVVKTGADGQPVRDAEGSYVFRDPAGRELDVRHERGGAFVPALAQFPDIGRPGLTVYVGFDGGQHSGDEGCVMRYKVANVAASSSATTLRYWNATPQHVGLGLCRRPGGTGANAPGFMPRPRYGDARQGCAPQLCVNDAHTH